MKKKIYPVVLSGGIGLRLWPSSTKSFPKQFLSINSKKSLLFNTLKRLENNLFFPATIIGSYEHRFLIKNELFKNKIKYRSIFVEPMRKNTMASIAICTLEILEKDPNAVILVLPSDHIIDEKKKFIKKIRESAGIINQGFITTFGVKPNHPSTSMGYISSDKKRIENGFLIKKFIEKPKIEKAKRLIKSKNSFWNSGIFLFSGKSFLDESNMHSQKTINLAKKVLEKIKDDLVFKVLPKNIFKNFQDIPFDKAIMEKTKNAAVVPVDFKWFDVGSWKGVWDVVQKDKNQNSLNKNVLVEDVHKSIIWAKNKKVVAIGLDNLVLIEDDDGIIIKKISSNNDIKSIIKKINSIKISQINSNQTVFRPWGEYKSIYATKSFLIKILTIYPKSKISLQYHNNRSEHWIVVAGCASVTKGKKTFKLNKDESTFIPKGEIHRLHNETNDNLVLVEVQTGDYLREDDIVRLEDIYGRIKKIE